MRLYAKNLVIATIASEVIGAEVEEDRITWRKGCSRDGMSKLLMSGKNQFSARIETYWESNLCIL